MQRAEAVQACVAEMRKLPRFQSAPDDQKAKAAEYLFDRLHEDAAEHLLVGVPQSDDDLRHYAKAASKRVHSQLQSMNASEFEQVNGFPILLALSLASWIWTAWKALKEWMQW